MIERLSSVFHRPFPGPTECVSSSRCQISEAGKQTTENRGSRAVPFPELPTFAAHGRRTNSCLHRIFTPAFEKDAGFRRSNQLSSQFRLVEPDGIEPTTSCLQSTRSPN